jgi:hypothetical protein
MCEKFKSILCWNSLSFLRYQHFVVDTITPVYLRMAYNIPLSIKEESTLQIMKSVTYFNRILQYDTQANE